MPPLGLITAAAILPQDWELRLVDRAVSDITEADWDWAEMVILSSMIVQKADMLAQIQEAKRRGKKVAVGGPYATSTPHECRKAGLEHFLEYYQLVKDGIEKPLAAYLAHEQELNAQQTQETVGAIAS